MVAADRTRPSGLEQSVQNASIFGDCVHGWPGQPPGHDGAICCAESAKCSVPILIPEAGAFMPSCECVVSRVRQTPCVRLWWRRGRRSEQADTATWTRCHRFGRDRDHRLCSKLRSTAIWLEPIRANRVWRACSFASPGFGPLFREAIRPKQARSASTPGPRLGRVTPVRARARPECKLPAIHEHRLRRRASCTGHSMKIVVFDSD